MPRKQPAKSRIARRLILYIVLFSSLITLLTTAIQLYRDYNTDLELIHSELQQIEGVHLNSLTAALWASNRKLLKTSIAGILKIRDMQYAEVRDKEQLWASSGKNIGKNTIQRQYSLNYRHRNKDINIGRLTVVVSLEGVYQRLIDKVWVILVSNAIKTTLVATFIYFLFLQLVGKHLSRISRFAETDDPLSKDKPLTLDRSTKKYDEFDAVVDSINDMHDRLHEQITEVGKQKQYLAQTLDSIGDAVIATDADGNVTRMNPVAEQLCGWSLEEARGQSLKTIFPIIDASTRRPIENPVDKVITTGKTVYLSNHTTLIAKDGTEYQIADSAAAIRESDTNNILGMVLVFNDVTEKYHLRMAADKSAQGLMDAQRIAHIGSWELDLATNKLVWSDEIYRIFEIDPEKFSASYDAFLNAIHPDDRDRVNNAYTESVKNKMPYSIKHRLRMSDGRIKHVTERCMTTYDEEGKPLCSVGTVQDTTEQVNLEETIRRSQKMDALGKLTGGIAHDYNNLLGIILGYAEQIREHLGTKSPHDIRLTKYTLDIQRAAERGSKLTSKLLAFSKHKTFDTKVVNINTMLLEQRMMLEKTLTAQIKLTYDLSDDLWPVELDSGELEDSVINLSINARHAMDKGGELSLHTHNQQLSAIDAQPLGLNAGEYVQFSMTDNGHGMSDTTKEKIFDPFFSTKGRRGTGLGLSQVYGFVKSSGGIIRVYSEQGHGSRFVLYFPRSKQTPEKMPTPAQNTTTDLHGSETLLVVDDEQALAELAQEILSAQGYRVLTANNGQQALEILEQKAQTDDIKLLISDVIMPNMDGFQLAAQVQQNYPQIKIQMVSGFADDRHNGLNDDALHKNILHKPYTSHTLLTRVRNLLDEETTNTSNASMAENQLSGRTILVMDDEENMLDLFDINLRKLGCKTIKARNADEAITCYQQSLNDGKTIDVVILDLSIPRGLGGKEVANKLHALHPQAKILVASGHSEGPEMTHPQDHGFQGALLKDFDRKKIKQALEQVLATNPGIS